MNHRTSHATPRPLPRGCALLAAVALAACSLLPDTHEDVSAYAIRAAPVPTAGPTVDWQLLVEEPEASLLLADTRIVVAPAEGPLGVLRGARWSDRAPALVQGLLLRGFEDCGRIVGVGRSGSSVRCDFMLLGDLRAFEVVYGPRGLGTVRVALSLRLVQATSNAAVAARVFEVEAAVQTSGTGGVVAAFDAATAELVPQAVEWTLTVGEAARNAKPR